MAEDGKTTIKLPDSLAAAIEPFLDCKNEFGIGLWDSKTKFVEAAVQNFIKQNAQLLQTIKMRVKA